MSKSVKRFSLASRSKLRKTITFHDFGSIRSKIIVISDDCLPNQSGCHLTPPSLSV